MVLNILIVVRSIRRKGSDFRLVKCKCGEVFEKIVD